MTTKTCIDISKTKKTRGKGTTKKKIGQVVERSTGSKFIANITQLLSRRHFLMLNDPDSITQSTQKRERKRYSNMSSMVNNENDFGAEFDPNHEMALLEDPLGNQLSYSITQGLQALKEQLNLDLNDLMKNGNLADENQDPLFGNFDLNNPDISNLLRTPPTMGTQFHSFRHNNDLRNQFDSNGEISSQSNSSERSILEDKNFTKHFGDSLMDKPGLRKMKQSKGFDFKNMNE